MTGDRITESELVLPSLYLMTQNNGLIRTSALITKLGDILKPEGMDAQILPNRKDTYFSQKVRNLKSHDTLERDGYATYSNGQFHITNKGISFVKNNIDSIRYLLHSGFDYDDMRHVLESSPQNQRQSIFHMRKSLLKVLAKMYLLRLEKGPENFGMRQLNISPKMA